MLMLLPALTLVTGGIEVVHARPPGPEGLCEVWPDAALCRSGLPDCGTCHTVAPARNSFGAQIAEALLPEVARPLDDATFADGLPRALRAVADLDADLDAFTNEEELLAGSDPADATSVPASGACIDADPDDGYHVCGYDPGYALEQIHYDVCGHAPPRGAVTAIQTSHASGVPVEAELHAALDRCLQTEHWRGVDGVIWRLGHTRIRPLAAISSDPDDPGAIPLANYRQDYAFFVYTQIDDHDARDLLLGDYFVRVVEGERTTYAPYDVGGAFETLIGIVLGTVPYGDAQFVDPERRAGLLTHRWFLMRNTMFTAVPRTTAAQAYRSWLGLDIARLEGLQPVPDEPIDYDDKGVQAPECALCHATLDPLTYPFTRYEGIGGGEDAIVGGDACDPGGGIPRLPFSYNANRMDAFVSVDGDDVANTPEAGAIFGQSVADLREWAQVAVSSDAFAENLVRMWWEALIGRPPADHEREVVVELARDLRERHEFSIERMLHDLILTEAYGAP